MKNEQYQDSIVLCECCDAKTIKVSAMKRGFYFRKCTNCKVVFVFPQPSLEELNDMYKTSEGYFATACTNLKLASPVESRQLHDTLLKYVSASGRLLDVGCSSGKLGTSRESVGDS